MEGMLSIVLNAVVIVLLSAAILFGIRLQRRLAALQSAQAELATLLGRLDGALVHASSTVSALKYSAAKQAEATILRAPATAPAPAAEPRPAEPPRPAAPVQTIKTAPVAVEAAKPATRRRKPTANLVGATGRAAAASELMDLMKTLRNAG